MKSAFSKFLSVLLLCTAGSALVQAEVVEIKRLHDDAHYFLALKQAEAMKFYTTEGRYYLIMTRADRICKSLGYKSVSDQGGPFVLKTYSGNPGDLVVLNGQYQTVESNEFPDDLGGFQYLAKEYVDGIHHLLPGSPIEAFSGGTYRFSTLDCLTK